MAQLADGLQKRQRPNVAHRAADLDDHNVKGRLIGRRGQASHRGFDFVGHMRDHLHCLAEIIAPPLARDDLLVDAPARKIVGLRKRSVRESFVVPQVQIGLRAIVGDEDLAMLKRTHRSRIDVQVWIELLQRDLEPAAFKQAAEAGCRNPFPQG